MPTATYAVRFEKRRRRGPGHAEAQSGRRIPRITRLLALAHRIDWMIRANDIRDWADAARLLGITRARMTQIAGLLLLAVDLQETIMELPPTVNGCDPVNEHDLRRVVGSADWRDQQLIWPQIAVPTCARATASGRQD
jgi:hypothetical protein